MSAPRGDPGACAEARDTLREAVLDAARAGLVATDAEAGLTMLAASAAVAAPPERWRAAVADAVRDGLVADPVRIPDGALHCEWRLELTPRGAAG